MIVASVAGPSITLAEPLRFTHWGTLQTIAGATIDERAEVGLLSRNIVVRGDERSEATGFGGHIMMMGGAVAHRRRRAHAHGPARQARSLSDPLAHDG